MLLSSFLPGIIEAGCDEAGRGCLAGPVCCAAVILPPDFSCPDLNDSKKLSERKRNELRPYIENNALAWAVAFIDNNEIDEINILNASIKGMHKALDGLRIKPEHIIVDGNRFYPYGDIPHKTIVKGDAKYMSIAAASVLAKTHRDELMNRCHLSFPEFGWDINKGYPTKKHREAIKIFGITDLHRKTFRLI